MVARPSSLRSLVLSRLAVLLLIVLAGMAAGVGVAAVAVLVSERGPAFTFFGARISLRGNGALFVPALGLPAVLAGGWSLLAIRLRLGAWPERWRLVAGLGAGMLYVAVSGVASLFPPNHGRLVVSAVAVLFALVVLGLSLGLAALFACLSPQGVLAGGTVSLMMLGTSLPIPPNVYWLSPPLVLSALVVALPLLLSTRPPETADRQWPDGWLIAANAALLVGLLAGGGIYPL